MHLNLHVTMGRGGEAIFNYGGGAGNELDLEI